MKKPRYNNKNNISMKQIRKEEGEILQRYRKYRSVTFPINKMGKIKQNKKDINIVKENHAISQIEQETALIHIKNGNILKTFFC